MFAGGLRPPSKTPARKTFVAKPETLSIVHEDLDGGRPAVAKNEDCSRERVRLHPFVAEARHPVDPTTKVRGIDRDEHSHLRGNLNHPRLFQNAFETAITSTSTRPLIRNVIVAPVSSLNSKTASP